MVKAATILRYGVVAGLVITVAGLVMQEVLNVSEAPLPGLWITVTTPIASLTTITVELIKKRDLRGAALAATTLAAIATSILTAIITAGSH